MDAIAIVGTFMILFILDSTIGLRVSEEDERVGLDFLQYREEGYEWADEDPADAKICRVAEVGLGRFVDWRLEVPAT